MLVVARRLLQTGCCFATARIRPRKQKNSDQQGDLFEKDAFKAYRKSVEQGSILRQFREQVFRRSQLSGDWNIENTKQREQAHKLQKLLNVDREEMLSKATLIQNRAIRERDVFDQNSGRSLLSDYGNYKPYNKVYPVLQDRNLGEGEYLEDSTVTENLYKFLDRLPDDYREKEEIQAVIHQFPANKQNMSLSEYGKELQKEINQGQRNAMKRYQDYKIHQQQKYSIFEAPYDENEDINEDWFENSNEDMHDFTGSPRLTDPWNNEEGFEATLSPQAVDTIYQLYLQGWTVRDISKRFGILPARTKFCVWVRAQLFHQVIPKLGVRYYLRALREEERYNQTRTFCDYGLDLDELSNDGILTEINEWNGEMLDAQRKEDEYRGAMMKLQKVKKFSKYEMVEVGTHGKQNSKYRLKEWVIFRGKGSDQYFLKNRLLKELTKAQKKFNKVYY